MVLSGVSRVRARQIVVMGLVRLRTQASGQSSSTSRAMSRNTGMLRSARMTPPGPTVSPTDWRTPWRSGISRSWRIDAKPPVEMFTTTKSASRSASRRSVVARAVSPTPRTCCEVVARARPCAAAARGRCRAARSRRRAQRGVDEVDEQLRRPLVAAATDDRDRACRDGAFIGRHRTLPARTARARPLTGQMDVGVVRCCPITNRGDPWAIEAIELVARRSPCASSRCCSRR